MQRSGTGGRDGDGDHQRTGNYMDGGNRRAKGSPALNVRTTVVYIAVIKQMTVKRAAF